MTTLEETSNIQGHFTRENNFWESKHNFRLSIACIEIKPKTSYLALQRLFSSHTPCVWNNVWLECRGIVLVNTFPSQFHLSSNLWICVSTFCLIFFYKHMFCQVMFYLFSSNERRSIPRVVHRATVWRRYSCRLCLFYSGMNFDLSGGLLTLPPITFLIFYIIVMIVLWKASKVSFHLHEKFSWVKMESKRQENRASLR